METIQSRSPTREPSLVTAMGLGALRLAWHSIRLPVLAVLIVLEPFVRVILSALAVLGVFFALFFQFLIRLPHFPLWTMLGISCGCALSLMMYYALIRLFSSRPAARFSE